MPRRIQWLPQAWERLQNLPGQLRKEALAAAGQLMVDPLPSESENYGAVPDTYRLNAGHVTLFYRIVDDEIDVVLVWPNS